MKNTKNKLNKSENGLDAKTLMQNIDKMLSKSGIPKSEKKISDNRLKATIVSTTPEQRELIKKKAKEREQKKPMTFKEEILNQYRKKGYSEEDLKEIEEEIDYYI